MRDRITISLLLGFGIAMFGVWPLAVAVMWLNAIIPFWWIAVIGVLLAAIAFVIDARIPGSEQ